MKYFLDTEFLEGTQDKTFLGFKTGKTKPTIDLISIGIVAEDGREYYAISKDFNIKEAWNRYDIKDGKKVYWIRENVLEPIYYDLLKQRTTYEKTYYWSLSEPFSYKSLSYLIKCFGKTNSKISEEVREFMMETGIDYGVGVHTYKPVEIYTYYGDYDWVAFCWLFGKMMDLPIGLPMYSRDLKQTLDETADKYFSAYDDSEVGLLPSTISGMIDCLKKLENYPKQSNEHNAIADARWNKKLYEFLKETNERNIRK